MPATIAAPVSGAIARNTAAATTLAVPYPAGVALGYLLEMDVAVSSATRPDNADALLAAGWVARGDVSSGGSSPCLRRWTKFADAGDVTASSGGTNRNVTTPNATSQGRMRHFGGNVDPVTTLDALCDSTHGTYSSSSAVTPFPIQGTTTSLANTMASLAAAGNSTAGTWSPPTATLGGTWNETWDDATTTPKITHDYWLWSSSGATGTVNVSPSAGVRGCAILTFYRPAPTLFALTGDVDGVSAASGSIALATALTGEVDAATTAAGSIGLAAALSGQVDGVSGISGAIGARLSLTGAVAGTSGATGSIAALLGLSGAVGGTSDASGTIALLASLGGTVTAVTSVSGTPAALLGFTGVVTAVSDVTGQPAALLVLNGAVVAISGTSGDIEALKPPIPVSFRITGYLRGPTVRGHLHVPALSGHLRVETVEGDTE